VTGQRTLCGDQAALVARLADLVGPEVLEVASLLDAMAHAHGLAWGKKVAR
jgi:hypothetical protein